MEHAAPGDKAQLAGLVIVPLLVKDGIFTLLVFNDVERQRVIIAVADPAVMGRDSLVFGWRDNPQPGFENLSQDFHRPVAVVNNAHDFTPQALTVMEVLTGGGFALCNGESTANNINTVPAVQTE